MTNVPMEPAAPEPVQQAASARPLITIVVRVDAGAAWVERALRAIQAQTYRPLEVVLVDAGSKPAAAAPGAPLLGDIAVRCRKLDGEGGWAQGVDAGIAEARGRYVAFVDEGSELDPAHIQTLVDRWLPVAGRAPTADLGQPLAGAADSMPWPPGGVNPPPLASHLVSAELYGGRVTQLESALAEARGLIEMRDARIRQLEQDRLEVQALHQSQVSEGHRQLAGLRGELDALHSSLGWRLLARLRRGRERLLPSGSRRRRLFDLGLRVLGVARREGIGSVLRKTARRLATGWDRALRLLRKARAVYRSRGALGLLRAVRAFARRRGDAMAAGVHAAGVDAAGVATGDRYARWIARHETGDAQAAQQAIEGFARRPTISIVTPVYNVDPKWLDRCIESVRAQWYPHWQLCLCDDGSDRIETRRALQRWHDVDARIVVSMSAKNAGIAAASNAALALASGDYVALLDHDDELSADALFEVVKLLDAHPDTDLVYSDEDRISEDGHGRRVRHDPFFKPDWSPHLMFACMYTGHLSVYRRLLLDELGGFRSEFDFSQDYDLALRASERTTCIRHLPRVLYHWRTLPGSAAAGGKDFARASNVAALQAACDRRGLNARALALPHSNRVLLPLPAAVPLVSIVIPTDSRENIFHCIELLLSHTGHARFEIVVVTNSALGREVAARHGGDARIRVVPFDRPFNFSLKCNEGADAASGEYLLFFNDDVQALEANWLTDMLGVFGHGHVGGVSPKLFYENDTIQFAGMITGVRGLVGTAFHTQHKDSGAYFNFIQSEREVSLLSGACLLLPRRVFDEVGGFDAIHTPIMHSDVDLCCRIRAHGYSLLYTPFAALRHIGHLSLKDSDDEPDRRKDKADLFLFKRWGEVLSRDPYHPENMTELLYHRGQVPFRIAAARQDDRLLDARDLLLVSHDLSLSGAPILLVYLAEQFRERGYFVTVMSPLGGELEQTLAAKNIPVVIDATLQTDPDPLTRKFMAAFDLVVANTIVAWPSVLAAKEASTPVLWLLHESHDGCHAADEEPRIGEALAAADDVIFACAATRALYERFRRADNFRVIAYGARALEAPAAVPALADRVRVVHVGSVEHRKGQDVLLDALARLPDACAARLQVTMIGRMLRPDFHATIAARLEASRHLRYVGQLPHERIAAELASADIYVSSSRDEVFPVTVLEAMSLGKAVIATAVGGVPEMIRDGIDGLLVPPDDAATLAAAIERLAGDGGLRQRLGASARSRFFECFTIDRLGERLLELIGQRLDQDQPSARSIA